MSTPGAILLLSGLLLAGPTTSSALAFQSTDSHELVRNAAAVGIGNSVRPPWAAESVVPVMMPLESATLRPVAASALIPGTGQLMQDRTRGWLYLLAEGLAWYLHVDRKRDGQALRDDYRDLAWDVARIYDGPRIDGTFGYYEDLRDWATSGAFDADPGRPGLQPESDPATFNGAIWARARALFFGQTPDSVGPSDPEWEAALDLYRREGWGPEFLWDWTRAPDERERFRQLIDDSDDHFQEATMMLGLIVANHLLSAADAFVSTRLEGASGNRLSTRLAVDPVADRGPIGPLFRLELRLEVNP